MLLFPFTENVGSTDPKMTSGPRLCSEGEGFDAPPEAEPLSFADPLQRCHAAENPEQSLNSILVTVGAVKGFFLRTLALTFAGYLRFPSLSDSDQTLW